MKDSLEILHEIWDLMAAIEIRSAIMARYPDGHMPDRIAAILEKTDGDFVAKHDFSCP